MNPIPDEEGRQQYNALLKSFDATIELIKPRQEVLWTVLLKLLMASLISKLGPREGVEALLNAISEGITDLKRRT